MAMNSCRPDHSDATQILKATAEQGRIDPIDQTAYPAFAGNPVMEFGKLPQEGEAVLAPGDAIVEIVARRDGRAGHQQQHLMEWIEDPPWFAPISELGKVLQKRGAPAEPPRSASYR
jgi:hypothetical protein